ncbi:MAG: hypothetical protein GX660_03170 [Clostridiaceae bacterium]|nr:hypothetical protein [Clostridiaceae bacterium]
MAFSKRKNKALKYIIMSLVVVIIISGLATGGFYLYFKNIESMERSYKEQIEDLKFELYNNKKHVFIPIEDITCGTPLTSELLRETDTVSEIDSQLFFKEEDFGKFARYDLKEGMPVMKYMVIDEKIADDLREEELNMLLLQSNLTKDKFIDVRITYGNGEDYLVLSKKKIRDIKLEQNTIWCWLNEKEILTLSSAIVDAYIRKGTRLYTVTYIEPGSQKDGIPTYPPNLDVLRIIENDPNILNRAKDYLAEQARTALDQRLSQLPQEVLNNIQNGFEQETADRIEKIQSDSQTIAREKNNKPSATPGNPVEVKPESSSGSTGKTQEKEGDVNGFFQ